MTTRLERMYLMNVVLYLPTTECVYTFFLISRTCGEAVTSLKTNPYAISEDLCYELKLFSGLETIHADVNQLKEMESADLSRIHLFDLTGGFVRFKDCQSLRNKVVKISKEIRFKEKVQFSKMCNLRTLKVSMEQQLENMKFWKSLNTLPKLNTLILGIIGLDVKDLMESFKALTNSKLKIILKIHHGKENDVQMILQKFPQFKVCCIENELSESVVKQNAILMPNKDGALFVSQDLLFSQNFSSVMKQYNTFSLVVENDKRVLQYKSARLNIENNLCLTDLCLKNVMTTKPVSLILPTSLTALTVDSCTAFTSLQNVRKIGLKELCLVNVLTALPNSLTALTLCKIGDNYPPSIKANLKKIVLHQCNFCDLEFPKTVEIVEVEQCALISIKLDNIKKLDIIRCTQLSQLSVNSVDSLFIHSCHLLTALMVKEVRTDARFVGCKFSKEINVDNVRRLQMEYTVAPLPDNFPNLQELTSIRSTSVVYSNMESLTKLVADKTKALPNNLVDLTVSNCLSLAKLSYPKTLRKMEFSFCNDLSVVDDVPEQITSLDISNCPSLHRIAAIGSKIKHLGITDCEQLHELVVPNSLNDITLMLCENLTRIENLEHTQLSAETRSALISSYS
ncbi:hypothetical protein EIN_268270 [Entamoeba invadens IP1]|uniref:Uncharacterized protein n=1 Tax=Entamoeba invadens IP1 TaxID=370355 RepID=A0A0A1U8C2_ENTIV|nr:hypothetical protein EIN_268270 [Entamoeba invadens IP1]ELP91081.1 hypothetical protein EIN_268270 [Entamoeba invadens IP1]|eukprot:XP_004257852.1 hypothetical protein EIN_268270 [Entamoeba invadens IP1]